MIKKTLYGSVIIMLALFVFSCGNNDKKDKVKAEDSISTDLNKLNEMISKDPQNADLYNQRAKVYIGQKNMDAALTDITKALNIDSTKAPYFVTLSDIYFAQGKAKNCRKTLEKCISLDPEYVDGLMKLAELHLFFKEYNKTFDYIKKVLTIDKSNYKAYMMKGVAYKEMGDTADAIRNMQKAVELNEDFYEGYIQLGIIFSVRHNRLAVDYLNNAIKVNPKSIEAHYALGMFYQENDELNKAMEEYTTILKIDPKYKQAHYNLGYIHLVYLKVYDVAVKHFTNAISADPNYAEAYYNRGYSYELLGDINNALLDYKKAIQLKPGYQKAMEGKNRMEGLRK